MTEIADKDFAWPLLENLGRDPAPSKQPPICSREVIGLIPAAGLGSRLAPLPGSKEVYPIALQTTGTDTVPRVKVVSEFLLERMRLAGIMKVYIVLRAGKWDIPGYFGDGSRYGMHFSYLMMGLPFGTSYTLDQAYPFLNDTLVALGFPDLLFSPDDAFKFLVERQSLRQADIVLGAVPREQPETGGMIDIDAQGRVHVVVEKPKQSSLRYSWFIAVWTPVFTEFIHRYLAKVERERVRVSEPQRELPIGDVIQAAIDQGIRVEAEVFQKGAYLDIGVPENLVQAIRGFGEDSRKP